MRLFALIFGAWCAGFLVFDLALLIATGGVVPLIGVLVQSVGVYLAIRWYRAESA